MSTSINYVSNSNGETTALLINLEELRLKAKDSNEDINEFLEELEDIISVELSRNQTGRPYDEVRKEILGE